MPKIDLSSNYTYDELLKAMSSESYNNPAAKEVVNYRTALWQGYGLRASETVLFDSQVHSSRVKQA